MAVAMGWSSAVRVVKGVGMLPRAPVAAEEVLVPPRALAGPESAWSAPGW